MSGPEPARLVEPETERSPPVECIEPQDGNAGPGRGGKFARSSLSHDGAGFVISDGPAGRRDTFDDLRATFGNTASNPAYPHDRGTGRINAELASPRERETARHLAETPNDNGWLDGLLHAVADALGCSFENVGKALRRRQSFDLSGVFARSLAECLALRLQRNGELDPQIGCALSNPKLIAGGGTLRLQNPCGIPSVTLSGIVRRIRRLYSGAAPIFDRETGMPSVPDVTLMRGDGSWQVEPYNESTPKALVDGCCGAPSSAGGPSEGEQAYIAARPKSADWLVRSLRQRADAITKVAAEPVRQQERFFCLGDRYLKLPRLQGNAAAVGLRGSTVNRVAANRFIGGDRDVSGTKRLFSTALVGSDDPCAHSAKAVGSRIRKPIEDEQPYDGLSDDGIPQIPRGDGIRIARRTVAKCRPAMRIPSSTGRRRQTALTA